MSLSLSVPKRKSAISLTPLIDVVFILLLFFMLTSSFVPWRVVETPLSVDAGQPNTIDKANNVTLTLKPNDTLVWVNDQAFSLTNQGYFNTLITEHNNGIFIIEAEDGVTLQALMNLADRLKVSGAKTVSIANAFATPVTQ